MLTVYLSSFVFGIILILASLVLGDKEFDHDADFDADMDVEVDADVDLDLDADADVDLDMDAHADLDGVEHEHEVDGGGDLPFFSVRFWTFFLSAFGMSGALLTWMDLPTIVHAPVAVVTGATIGTLIWWVFKQLKHGAQDATRLESLQGQEAEVLLTIHPGGTGKIRLLVQDRYIDMMANTKDGRTLKRGEKVLVVSVDGPTACVTPMGAIERELSPEKAAARRAKATEPNL
jgi:membrane protein implicated in regulation of membrane protease activity